MIKENFEQRAIAALKKYDFPFCDTDPAVVSSGSFEHGGQYGVEMPAINSLKSLQLVVKLLHEKNVYCTRFNETHGAFLLSNQEIKDMLAVCKDNGYGITFGLSARPEYDVKASFYRSKFGIEQGRQLNNNDAITQSIAELFRLVDLGCTGIIVYDLGVLRIIKTLRDKGEIPEYVKVKTSSHCMVTNSIIANIYEESGADSVTTSHDLSISMLQEIRRTNKKLVLDVPIDVYPNKGGFIRFYEMAKIVLAGAPVFFKMGASSQIDPYSPITEDVIRKRVERVAVGLEHLEMLQAGKQRIAPTDPLCCIPK